MFRGLEGRSRKMSRRFFAFFCIALKADINIVPQEKLCITTADT